MTSPISRDFRRLRQEMVETAIFDRGVRSELVLNAMRSRPTPPEIVNFHNLIASGRSLLLPVTTYCCPAGGRGRVEVIHTRFGLRIS